MMASVFPPSRVQAPPGTGHPPGTTLRVQAVTLAGAGGEKGFTKEVNFHLQLKLLTQGDEVEEFRRIVSV